jgi:hypothetical protein
MGVMDAKEIRFLAVVGTAALVFALASLGVMMSPGLGDVAQFLPFYAGLAVLAWGLPTQRRGWWLAAVLPVAVILELGDFKNRPGVTVNLNSGKIKVEHSRDFVDQLLNAK